MSPLRACTQPCSCMCIALSFGGVHVRVVFLSQTVDVITP